MITKIVPNWYLTCPNSKKEQAKISLEIENAVDLDSRPVQNVPGQENGLQKVRKEHPCLPYHKQIVYGGNGIPKRLSLGKCICRSWGE